ncbi:MAG TPA: hypothetical protein ENL11_06675 [Candidatus Acetothermia bacterium]|nr:hypothetical protein [Candidatus Acetothermia bacterium]
MRTSGAQRSPGARPSGSGLHLPGGVGPVRPGGGPRPGPLLQTGHRGVGQGGRLLGQPGGDQGPSPLPSDGLPAGTRGSDPAGG